MFIIKPYVKKQLLVALCVNFGQILLCFSLSWPGRWIFKESNSTTPEINMELQTIQIDLVFTIGLVSGVLFFGWFSNYKGRKPCFFISASILLCVYSSLVHLGSFMVVVHIAKFFTGLGSGIAYVGILVYLGEIASTNIRGLLLTSTNIFRYTQNYIDLAASTYIPSWVLPYFGLVVSICFIFAVFFIPESPVFFIMKGSKESLENSLISLGRENELESMLAKKTELKSVNKTQKDNWLDIIIVKSNIKAMFLTLTLNLLQCLSGVVGVLYFLPQIVFPIQHIDFHVILLVMITAGFVGAVFSVGLVDIVGRKTLLMVSTGSCAISMGILSTYSFINIWMISNITWSVMLLLIVINYFFSFALGFTVLPETLLGEMFTPNVRSTGSTVVVSTTIIFEYVISVLASNLIPDNLLVVQLGVLFVIYCLTNIIAFVFTWFMVPETKGLSLNEITETLHRKTLIRCSRSQS